MTRTRRLGLAAAIAGTALTFALSGVSASASDAPITITLTDGVIAPQKVEVPAGKATVLKVVNAGKSAAEFESKRLRIEQIIAPGKTVEIKLRALPKGSYPFVEEFHENLETGRGEIIAK